MIGCAIRSVVSRWVKISYSCTLLLSELARERMVIKL